MKDTELYTRLCQLGMPQEKAWPLTAKIRDVLHPVAAVAAAKLHAKAAGLGSLGASANSGNAVLAAVGVTGTGGASGAVKGAATGAGIGTTIFPGLGTAIGAAVGAIVGGLLHFGTGAQRLATATQIIQGLTSQPPPLSAGRTVTLQTITECYGALVSTGNFFGYVKPSPANSPSDIQNEFNSMMKTIAGLVQLMNANPIGATVTYSATGFNGISFSLTFVNPGTANTATVLQTAVIPAMKAWLTQMGRVDIANVGNDFARPIVQLVFGLMTDYVIGQNPPPPAQLSTQLATSSAPVAVPPAVASQATQVAASTAQSTPPVSQATAVTGSPPVATGSGAPLTPVQDTTAALLAQILANQQANMVTPQAQQVVADVAAEGVQPTAAGPASSLQEFLLPGLIAGAALLVVLAMKKK